MKSASLRVCLALALLTPFSLPTGLCAQSARAEAASLRQSPETAPVTWHPLASARWLESASGVRVIRMASDAARALDWGGWRMTRGEPYKLGDAQGLRFPPRLVRLALAPGALRQGRLALRVANLGGRQLTVYLDGKPVAYPKLSAARRLETVSVQLPEAKRRGTHELGLRAHGRGGRLFVAELSLGARDPSAAPIPVFESVAPKQGALRFVARSARGPVSRLKLRCGDGPARELRALAQEGDAGVFAIDCPGERVSLRLAAATEASLEGRFEVQRGELLPKAFAKGWNLVMLLVDTLRADRVHGAAARRYKTPVLDSLAEQGLAFDALQAAENWTKPSTASLLTGLYPWEHTAIEGDSVLPRSVLTLAESMRAEGYATGGFVANGYVSRRFGFKQGFDSWRNYIREGRITDAEHVFGDASEWLRKQREPSKPVFLYVHTIDPHQPYIVPQEWLRLYDKKSYAGPVNFRKHRQLLEGIKTGKFTLGDRDKERLEALYDAEVSYHDAALSELIKTLKDTGRWERTLFVVTSDHGEELFDHGSVGHGHSLWQELLSVPLIIAAPGQFKRALLRSDPAEHVAIMPSLLDMLGVMRPAALRERPGLFERDTAAVSTFLHGGRALRIGPYKLLQRGVRRTRLFHVDRDPRERRDLALMAPGTVMLLWQLLGQRLDAPQQGRSVRHRAQKTVVDATTRAQLEALGYVGSSAK